MILLGEIVRNSPIPYYYQLQVSLQNWIEESGFPPHTLLASEAELGKHYAVSRTVVRQALAALEREGLIYRVKGRGSFVSSPKLQQTIAILNSFSDDIQTLGMRPGGRVLAQELIPANELISQHMQVPLQTQVFRLQRLRTANEEPVAIETVNIHFPGCEGLLKEDFQDHSLYHLLISRYSLTFSKADMILESTVIHPTESALLNLNPGAPAMLIHRTTYDGSGRPFEYAKDLYRGDRYRFITTLKA